MPQKALLKTLSHMPIRWVATARAAPARRRCSVNFERACKELPSILDWLHKMPSDTESTVLFLVYRNLTASPEPCKKGHISELWRELQFDPL